MSPNDPLDDLPGAKDEPSQTQAGYGPRAIPKQERPAPPPPSNQYQPPGEESGPAPSDVLIAGPRKTGKTLYINGLSAACDGMGEPRMAFGYTEEIAALIARSAAAVRAGVDIGANVEVKEYDFSIGVTFQKHSLGVRRFKYIDGPGGALFYENPDSPNLAPAVQTYRNRLIEAGKSAKCLVFFVDPDIDEARTMMSGNLTHLLGDLQNLVSLRRAVNGHRNWWTPWQATPQEIVTEHAHKINAERVLFIFNRVDQICVRKQQEWEESGDPRAQLSPYEIAQDYIKPKPLALEILGPRPFRNVYNFLKDGAKVAVAVCSAGGFIRGTGDPYLDEKGYPNLLKGVPHYALEERLVLYGVREAMLFAGFDLATENIVEELTLEDIDAFEAERQGRN